MKILGLSESKTHLIIIVLGLKIKIKTQNPFPISNLFCFLIKNFVKVKNNKVIFINLCNWQYADNVKYIAEEFLNRQEVESLDFVWINNKKTKKELFPAKFRFVKYTSLRCLYELMTAKVWIANSHMLLACQRGIKKPKDTLYFQTCHGSMGIKKIDGDVPQVYDKLLDWTKWQKISASQFDYIFGDSDFERKVYPTAFWNNGNYVKLGRARDRIFYLDPKPYIDKVKEYFGIPQENKIILYAPTWREDKRCYVYNIDINLIKKVLKTRFGGEWSVLIRAHVSMPKNIFKALYNPEDVINCADYIDMQELLVATDILISDYSSCVPEFTILKKPSFLYCPDYDYYHHSNGFYYPLETLPSPIAKDNYELAQNILNFDEIKYKSDAEIFLSKMGHCDDENSCQRIVDFIIKKGLEENHE